MRVGQHTHAVVGDHAVGFVSGQLPHGQAARLLVHVEHRRYKIAGAFGLHQRIQRMRRSVGVPQRKHRVVRVVYVAVNTAVHTAVAAVHVAP